jgi:hypothetical protein
VVLSEISAANEHGNGGVTLSSIGRP